MESSDMDAAVREEPGDGELAREIEGEEPPPPCREGAAATAEDWRRALSRVVLAVVVLGTTARRAFDTEPAGASYATGFAVDNARGIILTNRHVVKPGPVVAEAMFVNREEIPVYPLYRDPVHDFGFFRYDPGAIKFLKYEEIPLAPEAACVGLEIRVVGNDSGEKIPNLMEFKQNPSKNNTTGKHFNDKSKEQENQHSHEEQSKGKKHPRTIGIGGIRKYEQQLSLRN